MRRGFTLIELLMVIAIIAIISTLAVGKVGGVREAAARKVSLANQSAVERGVSAFLAAGGALSRLDSLVYATPSDDPAGGGPEGFDFDAGDVLYRGPRDAVTEAETERNAGLTPGLLSVLTVYRLSGADVSALQRIGLRYVAQFTEYARERPADRYVSRTTNANADGSVPLAENGLDPLTAACVIRTVTNGMEVAAVTPLNNQGRLIYQACGEELLVTNMAAVATDMTAEVYDRSDATRAEVVAAGGPLLAFGLGDLATIVGKSDAGLESAPYATYAMKRFYSRYVILIRLRKAVTGPALPEVAGVIDCCGNTIRAARAALK